MGRVAVDRSGRATAETDEFVTRRRHPVVLPIEVGVEDVAQSDACGRSVVPEGGAPCPVYAAHRELGPHNVPPEHFRQAKDFWRDGLRNRQLPDDRLPNQGGQEAMPAHPWHRRRGQNAHDRRRMDCIRGAGCGFGQAAFGMVSLTTLTLSATTSLSSEPVSR